MGNEEELRVVPIPFASHERVWPYMLHSKYRVQIGISGHPGSRSKLHYDRIPQLQRSKLNPYLHQRAVHIQPHQNFHIYAHVHTKHPKLAPVLAAVQTLTRSPRHHPHPPTVSAASRAATPPTQSPQLLDMPPTMPKTKTTTTPIISSTTTLLIFLLLLLSLFPSAFHLLWTLPLRFLLPTFFDPSPPQPTTTPIAPTMSWSQKQFTLPSRSRGSYLITDLVMKELGAEIKPYKVGLLHLFVQHTSCGLTLNENWDSVSPPFSPCEVVRADMWCVGCPPRHERHAGPDCARGGTKGGGAVST